jgi:cytochrome c556
MKSYFRPHNYVLSLVFFLAIAGCSWAVGGRASETTPMHERFSKTVDIQMGLVLGDLDRAAEGAQWLTNLQGDGEPGGSAQAFLSVIRAEASQIIQSTEVDAAAGMVGRIGAACGGCHLDTGAGPNFVQGSASPEGTSTGKTMIRHLWGADRLWEGLIGPSEASWEAGAQALDRDWEAYSEVVESSPSPAKAREYASKLQELGARAKRTEALEVRASVFGEILGSCQGCHAIMGGR